MQRSGGNNRRNPYTRSGLTGKDIPGVKRRRRVSGLVRNLLLVALIIGAAVAVVYGISHMVQQAGQAVHIGARPDYNMKPFGENLVYYDGMALHCVGPTGATRWSYTMGTGGDFACGTNAVVAWNDNQLHVLNQDGKPTHNDRMDANIRFARVGEGYVATCYGEELSSTVRVSTLSGALMESQAFDDLYLLDIGFFYNKDQLMWVLGLDVYGNAPIMNLSTYEPGKLSTGAVELQDELVYRIYVHDNMMMVVDTTKIRAFNYKCVEQTDFEPILTYGWQVKQTRTVSRNTYALLEKMPTAGDTMLFSELRLVTNGSMKSLRLLTPCFASGLGEKGVYGFGENVIYFAPYGSGSFKASHQTYSITELVCMLDGGRAVVVTGNDVYIITLPT